MPSERPSNCTPRRPRPEFEGLAIEPKQQVSVACPSRFLRELCWIHRQELRSLGFRTASRPAIRMGLPPEFDEDGLEACCTPCDPTATQPFAVQLLVLPVEGWLFVNLYLAQCPRCRQYYWA